MRKIETHFVAGPAGRLEALLEEPETGAPRAVALVCHPHPLYGGTMHNKVVYRMARALRHAGCVVLRFNFRGVGRSEGIHDQGRGEVEDARACLEWLRARYPDLPFVLAGFSFGSRVVLRLGCGARDARAVIAAGFPTLREPLDFLGVCGAPKIFLQSTQDEHGPRGELEALFAEMAEPKRLEFIPAADHFFKNALDEFEQRMRDVVSADILPARGN